MIRRGLCCEEYVVGAVRRDDGRVTDALSIHSVMPGFDPASNSIAAAEQVEVLLDIERRLDPGSEAGMTERVFRRVP